LGSAEAAGLLGAAVGGGRRAGGGGGEVVAFALDCFFEAGFSLGFVPGA
jgi:hypothetical protein